MAIAGIKAMTLLDTIWLQQPGNNNIILATKIAMRIAKYATCGLLGIEPSDVKCTYKFNIYAIACEQALRALWRWGRKMKESMQLDYLHRKS